MDGGVIALILAAIAFIAGIVFQKQGEKGKEADAKAKQARVEEEKGAVDAQLSYVERMAKAKEQARKDVDAGVSGDSAAARLAARLAWSIRRRKQRQSDGDG